MSGVSIATNMVQNMFTGTSVALRKDGVFYAKEQETSLVYLQVAVRATDDVSAMAQAVVKRIAHSSLAQEQKEALIRLAAFVDQNGAEPSFYRDIMALVALMEMGEKSEEMGSDAMTEEEALEIFRENQKEMQENEAVTLSVDVAFSQFETKYLGGIVPKAQAGSADSVMQALNDLQDIFSGGLLV